jgi:hypothetical protein
MSARRSTDRTFERAVGDRLNSLLHAEATGGRVRSTEIVSSYGTASGTSRLRHSLASPIAVA